MNNTTSLEQLFEELYSLSQAILSCDAEDLTQFHTLLEARGKCLQQAKRLREADTQDKLLVVVETWATRFNEVDIQVDQRLQAMAARCSSQLRTTHHAQKALVGYKFPRVVTPSRLENRG